MPETDLTNDHKALTDDIAARRYFAKFERITGLMSGVVGEMASERQFTAAEGEIVAGYAAAIAASFRALSMKYLIAGKLEGMAQRHLTIDLHESGFPVFQEIATLANDAAEAAKHLAGMPPEAQLKDEMVRQIVGDRIFPVKLQYALSQRLYYEALEKGGLFLAQMHPEAIPAGAGENGRRRFLIHWAVYDSQLNVPLIYLLEAEDSGKKALPEDARRWPEVQAHLLAQSVGGLKLLTIAKGVDTDFADLYPKRLRRIYVGPMYSSAFTLQTGPIRDVLEGARAAPGEDWAMAWTIEELVSERSEVKEGWFSVTETEVFRLDPFFKGEENGVTRITRNLILPQLPYQVLAEKDPEGFRAVRKYVVGKAGQVVVQA